MVEDIREQSSISFSLKSCSSIKFIKYSHLSKTDLSSSKILLIKDSSLS